MNLLIVLVLISSSFLNLHGSEKVVEDTEPYSGGVVFAPDGTGPYIVCVDEAEVRGGPEESRSVHYTLPRGTKVNVRERFSRNGWGWAMIQPAYWVRATDLCEK